MSKIEDREREQHLRDWLDNRFLRFRRRPGREARDDEISVNADWCLVFPNSESPLLARTERDFRRFCETCMQIQFDGAPHDKCIRFELTGTDPDAEHFTLTVEPGEIRIEADGELGLLRGAMRVLRTFADEGGPFLARQSRAFSPAFQPRIANTMFCPPSQRLLDSDVQFSPANLALMSLYDVSGVHAYLNVWEHARSASVPELCAEPSVYEQNLAALRAFCRHTASFGIRVYPIMMAPVLAAAHPAFQRHPGLRGALTRFERDMGVNGHCLCASSELTQSFYAETFSNLFQAVPELGGLILIVGGESFFHCYTRPAAPFSGYTNCPQCTELEPSAVIARLMNRIAACVHDAAPAARTFIWPYSAFVWSEDDRAQFAFIDQLSTDISFLSNLATGDCHPATGAALYDYNIVQIGPSTRFAAQTEQLRASNRPHYAKIECATTPSMFQFPYLPLHYRWAQRAAAMREHGVAGLITHWRFYGFTGSLPEEILNAATWEDVDADTLLERHCRREFGTFTPAILAGWRHFSAAWDKIPYSATLAGERHYYMRGPLYLGPAHPFIFDSQNDYGLERGFRRLRGDAAENFREDDEAALEAIPSAPTYAADLLWTQPVGVDRAMAMFREALALWDRGLALLEQALPNPNAAALDELGICRIIGVHFRTCLHLAAFYRQRDCFFRDPLPSVPELNLRIRELRELLDDEIANAESAISLLRRDARLGYIHCYGIAYDALMVKEKIAQCRFVRDEELPELAKGLRFHLFTVFP